LWSTFGIGKIRPFKDTFNKTQMLEWKTREEVQKVHEELYQPSDPKDLASDTFLTVIIKTVFPSEKERTNKNAMWTQSVLEAIFDTKYLSSKIDADIVETWHEALADADLVNICVYSVHVHSVLNQITNVKILYLGGGRMFSKFAY
jgi:hypothetical protein